MKKNKVISLFKNNKVIPSKGVKYSELLEQFMAPFESYFQKYEYIEDIIEFSINAWNMANMNVIMPNEDIEKVMTTIEKNEASISLLRKMVDHKKAKYKAFTNFIVDFELNEAEEGGDPILSVITQKEDTYLYNMLNEIKEGSLNSEDDYEENFINRNAIVIKPLQPFIDWHNDLYPDSKIDETDIDETNIYLIDNEIDDIEKWLKKKFDKFFMMELNDWHTYKKEWPQRRNYKMFKQWFQVEISKMIYDLEKKPVLKS